MMERESMTSNSPSKTWSETRRGRIVIFAGMMGLFALVFWMSMKSRRMLAAPTALVVDEEYLSFGEVWEEPAFVWKLPIRNTTNQDVVIAGFDTSCSCGKIEPSSLTIAPQGTSEVRLSLNLLSAHSEPDLAAKDFEVAVQPRINKGAGTQAGWVVHGKVLQPFAIDPPVVDFEESLVRGEPFAPRSTVITCGLDVAKLMARCDLSSLTTQVMRDTKNPRRFRLEIQPRKDMPGGPFNHLVRLAALTPSKKEVSGAVSVVGRVVEEVSLQPEVLAFGAEAIGTKLQETVTLQSRSGKDFTIQEINKGGASGITANMGRKRKDGSQSYIVSFPVTRLGHQEYTIHVKVNTPQGLLDLPLRMNCYGILAHAADARK